MQQENDDLIFIPACHPGTCNHHLAQLNTGMMFGNELEIVRIVILAVDEDNLLFPTGNV